MTCTDPAIGLVIAKVPYFPPIPVAKVHGNHDMHSDTMENLKQKYGKQNITIVTVGEKYNVLDKQQLQQPSHTTIATLRLILLNLLHTHTLTIALQITSQAGITMM